MHIFIIDIIYYTCYKESGTYDTIKSRKGEQYMADQQNNAPGIDNKSKDMGSKPRPFGIAEYMEIIEKIGELDSRFMPSGLRHPGTRKITDFINFLCQRNSRALKNSELLDRIFNVFETYGIKKRELRRIITSRVPNVAQRAQALWKKLWPE